MKITKSQLKSLIKEEVSRFKKIHILENRKRKVQRELRMLNESDGEVSSTFNVEIPDWLTSKLEQVHTKPGQGSIFAKPIKSVMDLVKSHLTKMNPKEVEKIANSTGTVTINVSGIGYDLVLPMEKAKTLKDAQQVEVEKVEGPNKINVPAIKTSEDVKTFSTGLLTIIVRPKKDDSGNVLKGQYIVLSAFPGNPDIPRASEWNGKFAVIIPNSQLNESIRKIVREGFLNLLNESVEIMEDVYDDENKELFNKIKKDLLTISWINDGQIDTDHYELFGRDSSEDLENAIEWGEINSENVASAIEGFLEDRYENMGVKIEAGDYANSNNISVNIIKDQDNKISFDIKNEL